MLVEIPEGWKTGKHSHGEEVMFVIEGAGATVIDGERFDWEKGSTIFMPFGAVHQHFNTGSETVRLIAANAIHLERFVGLARAGRSEDADRTAPGKPGEPRPMSGVSTRKFGRLVLHEGCSPAPGHRLRTARRTTFTRAGLI